MKIIFFTLVCVSFAFSAYEKVKIGKIDSYYQDKITKYELKIMIKEIENTFESQLGFNVFDYSNSGKPIDLLYLPPSKKKNQLNKTLEESSMKKNKIAPLQEQIIKKGKKLTLKQTQLKKEYESLNKDIDLFNAYVKKIQNKQSISDEEYMQIEKELNLKKRELYTKKNRFNQKKRKYNSLVASYNQQTSRFNTLVKQFNRLQRKIEVLSRNLKEVKGVAKGYTQTTLETFVKNGQVYTQRKKRNYMEKIELYDFESKAQLKTTLAHEIAHLVGVKHINVKGALMNPVLQENQIKHLRLTPQDIKAFQRVFN